MGHTKHTLIADFGTQKEGASIIVADCKADYFIENGYIKGKKKKTKTKKIEEVKEEVKEVIKEN
tara:strand:- start:15539 stop:15730 length:192 start_codon:yes stop_codon:yes gene_type:complete